jgi:D-alanyl-D-alanine carboxypeptidase
MTSWRFSAFAALCVALAGCTSTDRTSTSSDASSDSSSHSSSTPAGSSGSAGLPWPAPPTTSLPDDLAPTLQAELTRWVDAGYLPGVTAAVVSPDGVWSGAAGVDGLGSKLQSESGMALGTITQTFTAAELMLLAEQGVLDLDAAASTYLPVRQLANGATVRQLLSHRSSVPDPEADGSDPYAHVNSETDAHWSPERFLEPVAKATKAPGRTFSPHCINYVLLGQIIEKVSGRAPAVALREDLWEPLGLSRLAYQDEQRLAAPVAAPGEDEDLPKDASGKPFQPFRSVASMLSSCAGVAGDAESVARWGYELYGARSLTAESVAQITDFDDGDGFGLGTSDFTTSYWQRWGIDGVGHLGDEMPGYRAVLAVYPSIRLSVAVLSPSSVDTVPFVRYLVTAGSLTDE